MRDVERELIDEWDASRSDEWIEKRDPADDSLVGRVPVATVPAIVDAVRTARRAAQPWARTAPAQRAAILHQIADAVAANADELAWLTTREMGKPLADARGGVDAGIGTLRQYAELGPLHRGRSLAGDWSATDLMVFEPRGVVAVITPWNDPVAVSCGLLGAALVTGNTVVYKPSERTPGTGWLLGKVCADVLAQAGAPSGVLTTLSGGAQVGARLVEERLDLIAQLRIGPGTKPETQLGPLVDRQLREAVHEQVTAARSDGAHLRCGGEPLDGPGAFYPPTVLADCTDAMTVMREETFGPVAPVAVVHSFDEAVERAGTGDYGLAATVLTNSMAHAQQAWRDLPVGTVKINDVFGGAPGGAAQPRRASGQGFGYGPELLDEFSTTKVVHLTAAMRS